MKILKLLSIFALGVTLSFGQTIMGQTTLSQAVGKTDKVINLTSVTGVSGAAANNQFLTMLFVDMEPMNVLSVSGTQVTVQRASQASRQVAHASGAVVWVGPPSYFKATDPTGACTATNELFLPLVNFTNGLVWNCGTNGVWTRLPSFQESGVGTVIASATTIAPTTQVFHVSGTTPIVNITAPLSLPAGGCLTAIPNAAFTTTTAGNILHASTAVAGVAMTFCLDSAGKFSTSY